MDGLDRLAVQAQEKRPLLFTGAGSTASLGYPDWRELVRQLAETFAPGCQLTGDHLLDVDTIAQRAEGSGTTRLFLKTVNERFSREGRSSHDLGLLRRLLSVGFAGLVTTNFDTALEDACTSLLFSRGATYSCQSIDLQDPDNAHRLAAFRRSLDSPQSYASVLHLHGIHSSPRRLVLGKRSFETAYGHDSSQPLQALATPSARMLWEVLSGRSPVLFVGFGVSSDPFFKRFLELVQSDASLSEEAVHFAIMPRFLTKLSTTTPEDLDAARRAAELQTPLPGWIVPIFYDVVDGDYRKFSDLIDEMAGKLGPGTTTSRDRLIARSFEEVL